MNRNICSKTIKGIFFTDLLVPRTKSRDYTLLSTHGLSLKLEMSKPIYPHYCSSLFPAEKINLVETTNYGKIIRLYVYTLTYTSKQLF